MDNFVYYIDTEIELDGGMNVAMCGDGDPKEQLFGFFNDANNNSAVVGNLLEDIVSSLQEDGYKNLGDELSHYILNMLKNEAQNEKLFFMSSFV